MKLGIYTKLKHNWNSNCLFICALVFVSCAEFLDVGPPATEIVSETVYSDNATALAAARGMYIEMLSGTVASGGAGSLSALTGLSSDELIDFTRSSTRVELNTNNLTSNNTDLYSVWKECYRTIYLANSVLEGLGKSKNVSTRMKNQLEGEARFIRAFYHFYLMCLFGDIPVVTSTSDKINNSISKTSEDEVLSQVISDLIVAQQLLDATYVFSDGERVQPNRFAATALLSRVYLHNQDWLNAEIQASQVIENDAQYRLKDNLNEVFLANSQEAIWQLKPIVPGMNTLEARVFINVNAPSTYILSDQLLNAFEPGDRRRTDWIGSILSNGIRYYHAFKYKVRANNQPLTEYSTVLRLAEQYLIRAEARARQNKIPESISDVDSIRKRAGLPLISDSNPSIGQAELLLAIEQERRVELFTEWGHRWLDLKRTNRATDVLSLIDIKDWNSYDVLYPIPNVELEINVNLTQNEGY